MTIKVPKYFTRFKCIAEKCRDNCCIGWQIVIDDELMEKYKNLDGSLGEKLRKNIGSEENIHFFKLDNMGRCPFLNSSGLCDIITERGDGYLCEICREHPRYYNVFRGLCEGGIGMACESGAMLILSAEDDEFIEIEGDFAECPHEYSDEVLSATIAVRDRLLGMCADGEAFDECALLNLAGKLDEKYGFGDDRLDEINTLDAINATMTLTPFNEQFKVDLARAKNSACEVKSFIEGRGRVYFLRLLRYFIRRHFIDSVYTLNPLSALRMCLASAKVIMAIYLSRSGGDCVYLPLLAECAKDYSKSVEYKPDNVYDLTDSV